MPDNADCQNSALTEIIKNALIMAAEESGIAAASSASSAFVSQSSAIACAVFDAQGRLVAQTNGGLLHVSALRAMLPEVLREHPPETLGEGDAILLNDPFRGGIHPTDVGVIRPVFHAGQLVFYCGAMMIVSDLGGLSAGGLPANATECFHEGIILPPVRYFSNGERNADVMRLLTANSRTPEKIIGDIDALVVGCNVGAKRLIELLEKYGGGKLNAIIDHLLDYTEQMTRLGISAMPDGVYRGSYSIEEDGIETGRAFEVQVTITIDDSHCHMDFSGTSEQARGAINSSQSQSLSAVVFALRCYLDPSIPLNEGVYRTLSTEFPQGTLVNPRYPAACNLRMATVHAMIDAINRALAQAYPERMVASPGIVSTVTAQGVDPDSGHHWSFLDVSFGTSGARSGMDAVDGTPFILYGTAGYDRNIETYECQYPLRYRCYRFACDTAGPGQWRGGSGLIKEIEFLSDALITVRGTDRFQYPPQGVADGLPGSGSAWILNRGRPDETELPSKRTNYPIKSGDILTVVIAGGGGCGDPHLRHREKVSQDVRLGLVSRSAAANIYGTAID